jgi:carbonic anhydrase/acetyltransferase-like protein (isoleucine patch superfamily)
VLESESSIWFNVVIRGDNARRYRADFKPI